MSNRTLHQKIHNFYKYRVTGDWRGGHIMRGLQPGLHSIRLTSNDYLAIANLPSIVEAQQTAFNDSKNHQLMSAIFLHGDNPQADFENRMADFLKADEVVLCQSGYNANTGLIQALLEDTGLPVYIDMLAHMSLWDGVKMADCKVKTFRHNNVEHLLSLIDKHGPGLVLVDSIYSTNGAICPLKDLVNNAWEKECTILVDESHSLGTHGSQGSGLVVEYGLEDKVLFRTASLAKAFAGRAGIITGPKGFSDFFKFTSKPSIFSTALLPYEIAGLSETLSIIIDADDRREQLRKHSAFLRSQLEKMGYNLCNSQSQIISLESGTEWNTIVLRDNLEANGIFGSPFCAPATPKNRALIRFSINAGLTDLQIQRIANVCRDIRQNVKLEEWPSSRRLAQTTQSHAKAS